MLIIRDLTFRIAGRRLFNGASATVPAGRRVGVVGRNGGGKTTLFRLIEGALTPESGDIAIPKTWRVGGVAQEAPATDDSLVALVLQADAERAALMAEAETASDPGRIAEIQTRLVDIGAHSAEARAASILSGLGFDADAQTRPAKSFSGGWRMRVSLAGALFAEPDLLLLDEPTNYLDFEGAAWLEKYLARYPRTAMVISHDRGLLNRSVDSILHVDREALTYYGTPFDQFQKTRAERAAVAAAAAKKQAAERAHLQAFVDRFRAKASKARQAQSRVKALEKMPPIQLQSDAPVAAFAFAEPEKLSPPLIALDDASVGYGAAPVLSGLDLRVDDDDRIALLGANGEGKSTLLKLLAGALAPMGGGRAASAKLRVGFFAQHQLDTLDLGDTPVGHLAKLRPHETPTHLRTRLGTVGLTGETAETAVGKLSGGQKARLAMALAALDKPHLLMLDEPTNHLDIESREALIAGLTAYEGAVLVVSHDADFIARTADRLWLVEGGAVRPFEGDLSDYEAHVLRRRAAQEAADAAPEPERAAAKKLSASERRRRLRPAQSAVEKAEARIETLETERAAVDAALADPSLYESADGATRLEALSRQRAKLSADAAEAEAAWEAAAEALETAEAALDA